LNNQKYKKDNTGEQTQSFTQSDQDLADLAKKLTIELKLDENTSSESLEEKASIAIIGIKLINEVEENKNNAESLKAINKAIHEFYGEIKKKIKEAKQTEKKDVKTTKQALREIDAINKSNRRHILNEDTKDFKVLRAENKIGEYSEPKVKEAVRAQTRIEKIEFLNKIKEKLKKALKNPVTEKTFTKDSLIEELERKLGLKRLSSSSTSTSSTSTSSTSTSSTSTSSTSTSSTSTSSANAAAPPGLGAVVTPPPPGLEPVLPSAAATLAEASPIAPLPAPPHYPRLARKPPVQPIPPYWLKKKDAPHAKKEHSAAAPSGLFLRSNENQRVFIKPPAPPVPPDWLKKQGAPHETAPHETAPHETAPHETAQSPAKKTISGSPDLTIWKDIIASLNSNTNPPKEYTYSVTEENSEIDSKWEKFVADTENNNSLELGKFSFAQPTSKADESKNTEFSVYLTREQKQGKTEAKAEPEAEPEASEPTFYLNIKLPTNPAKADITNYVNAWDIMIATYNEQEGIQEGSKLTKYVELTGNHDPAEFIFMMHEFMQQGYTVNANAVSFMELNPSKNNAAEFTINENTLDDDLFLNSIHRMYKALPGNIVSNPRNALKQNIKDNPASLLEIAQKLQSKCKVTSFNKNFCENVTGNKPGEEASLKA